MFTGKVFSIVVRTAHASWKAVRHRFASGRRLTRNGEGHLIRDDGVPVTYLPADFEDSDTPIGLPNGHVLTWEGEFTPDEWLSRHNGMAADDGLSADD